MRLAFILNSLQTGGAEIHTVGLARELAGRGHHCTVITLSPRMELQIPAEVARLEVHGTGLFNLLAMRRLAKALKAFKPDIIVGVNERPLIYAQACAPSVPLAKIVAVYHTTDLSGLRKRLNLFLARPSFWASDALVFVSANQKLAWERRWLRSRRNLVIPNGIDTERYRPAEAAVRAEARASLGYDEDDYVVVMTAAFRPEKNHVQALDALRSLRSEGVTVKLLLVGDGPTRSLVEERVRMLGLEAAVTFAGRQTDVTPFLAASDVGLLTSTSIETLSIAALEASAMGIPMVMSNIGGASEIVEDRRSGCLFGPGDTKQLVEALSWLRDPKNRKQASTESVRRVRATFGKDEMVHRYETLFDDLARDA